MQKDLQTADRLVALEGRADRIGLAIQHEDIVVDYAGVIGIVVGQHPLAGGGIGQQRMIGHHVDGAIGAQNLVPRAGQRHRFAQRQRPGGSGGFQQAHAVSKRAQPFGGIHHPRIIQHRIVGLCQPGTRSIQQRAGREMRGIGGVNRA